MISIHKFLASDFGGDILKNTHLAVFGKSLDAGHFRFDYAFISMLDDKPVSYTLVREIDADTCEFTYGGTVPDMRGNKTVDSFAMFLNSVELPNVVIQVHNENIKMLSLGIYMGFKIIGTRVSNDGKMFVMMNKKVKGE